MLKATKLLIANHLKSWRIAIEAAMLITFVGFLSKPPPLAKPQEMLQIISFFSLALAPVTAQRVSYAAASVKSQYLIATGLGRRGYILAVLLSCVIIDFVVMAVAFLALLFIAKSYYPNLPGISITAIWPQIILTTAILALTISIYIAFSKLIVPRWGRLVALCIIIFAAFADEKSFSFPAGRLLFRKYWYLLPQMKRAVNLINSGSLRDWPVILGQLLAFTLIFTMIAIAVFQSKELIFDEF